MLMVLHVVFILPIFSDGLALMGWLPLSLVGTYSSHQ